jgi:hypothetical protein
MSDSYTFKYLNSDGSLNGMTMIHCEDRQSAQREATRLMPKSSASLEIWRDDKLVSALGLIQPTPSNRMQSYLNHPMDLLPRD